MQKDTSPAPSSCGGKPLLYSPRSDGRTSINEGSIVTDRHIPMMPLRFTKLSRSPFVCSLSLEHQQVHPTTASDQMSYCIHIRMTLVEGRGDQLPPFQMWSGSLITDMLQGACTRDHITETVVLALRKVILFFGRHSYKEELLYRNAKEVELSLRVQSI